MSSPSPPRNRRPDRGADWTVTCADVFGRLRTLGVIRKDSQIVLMTPPGESAVLDLRALEELTVGLAREAGLLLGQPGSDGS